MTSANRFSRNRSNGDAPPSSLRRNLLVSRLDPRSRCRIAASVRRTAFSATLPGGRPLAQSQSSSSDTPNMSASSFQSRPERRRISYTAGLVSDASARAVARDELDARWREDALDDAFIRLSETSAWRMDVSRRSDRRSAGRRGEADTGSGRRRSGRRVEYTMPQGKAHTGKGSGSDPPRPLRSAPPSPPRRPQPALGYDPNTLNVPAAPAIAARALSTTDSVRCPSKSSRKK